MTGPVAEVAWEPSLTACGPVGHCLASELLPLSDLRRCSWKDPGSWVAGVPCKADTLSPIEENLVLVMAIAFENASEDFEDASYNRADAVLGRAARVRLDGLGCSRAVRLDLRLWASSTRVEKLVEWIDCEFRRAG